jgi:hypothetical protein
LTPFSRSSSGSPLGKEIAMKAYSLFTVADVEAAPGEAKR